MKQLKIPYNNDFTLVIPLRVLYDGEVYDAEEYMSLYGTEAMTIANSGRANGEPTYTIEVPYSTAATSDEGYWIEGSDLFVNITTSLVLGSYDILVPLTDGNDSKGYALRLNNAFTIVAYNGTATFADIAMKKQVTIEPQVLAVLYRTDADYEQLKAQLTAKIAEYEEKIAEAEAAKEAFEEKASALDDVAQESTVEAGIQQGFINGTLPFSLYKDGNYFVYSGFVIADDEGVYLEWNSYTIYTEKRTTNTVIYTKLSEMGENPLYVYSRKLGSNEYEKTQYTVDNRRSLAQVIGEITDTSSFITLFGKLAYISNFLYEMSGDWTEDYDSIEDISLTAIRSAIKESAIGLSNELDEGISAIVEAFNSKFAGDLDASTCTLQDVADAINALASMTETEIDEYMNNLTA